MDRMSRLLAVLHVTQRLQWLRCRQWLQALQRLDALRWLRVQRALRTLLVAGAVCLFGTGAEPVARAELAATDAGVRPDHAADPDFPAPAPAVAEERDEDPRGSEDDAAHGPATGLAWLAAPATRLHMIRGPPDGGHEVTWRPRSSRGPPAAA